ncbi:tetratricopeptide repeat protein [Morganella morganii]|uniref:tetratricopeptide repeat protein n=1 Tax=Morganella morganii TaxID=582 RepID=UPI003EB7C801
MKKQMLSGLLSPAILLICLTQPVKAANLEEMAQQGDTDAMIILSYKYLSEESGTGTEKAKYWLGKAAGLGDTDAQGVLGTLYYTEKNYAEAEPLLTGACSHNNQPACKLLSKLREQQKRQ